MSPNKPKRPFMTDMTYSVFGVYTIRTVAQRFATKVAIALFDSVNSLLPPSNIGNRRPVQSSECDEWSESDITQRYIERYAERTERERNEDRKPWSPDLIRICPDTVVKLCGCSGRVDPCPEVLSTRFIEANTSIPVPHIRCVFFSEPLYGLAIVLERVHGVTLRECWPSLSFWRRIKIVFTLRRYILQLRQLSSNRPGPPGEDAQRCKGIMFMERYPGPFDTYEEFSYLMNRKIAIAKYHGWSNPKAGPFDDSQPMVFTHNDLNMNNIMIGHDGRVWLIDWAWSGFFPRWFEHYAMAEAAEKDETPLSWRIAVPFISDPYFWQATWTIGVSGVFQAYLADAV